MVTVLGITPDRVASDENQFVVGGSVASGRLLLTTKGGAVIDAGGVGGGGSGTGLPAGGTQGQLLSEDASGNPVWIDPPVSLPAGGTAGKILTVASDGTFVWANPVSQLPAAGLAGQVLVKNSDATGDVLWSGTPNNQTKFKGEWNLGEQLVWSWDGSTTTLPTNITTASDQNVATFNRVVAPAIGHAASPQVQPPFPWAWAAQDLDSGNPVSGHFIVDAQAVIPSGMTITKVVASFGMDGQDGYVTMTVTQDGTQVFAGGSDGYNVAWVTQTFTKPSKIIVGPAKTTDSQSRANLYLTGVMVYAQPNGSVYALNDETTYNGNAYVCQFAGTVSAPGTDGSWKQVPLNAGPGGIYQTYVDQQIAQLRSDGIPVSTNGLPLPAGGSAGQTLQKNSGTDGDASWYNLPTPVSISSITLEGPGPAGQKGVTDTYDVNFSNGAIGAKLKVTNGVDGAAGGLLWQQVLNRDGTSYSAANWVLGGGTTMSSDGTEYLLTNTGNFGRAVASSVLDSPWNIVQADVLWAGQYCGLILSPRDASGSGISWRINNSGTVQFENDGSSVFAGPVTPSPALVSGTWYTMRIVYVDGHVRGYINGTLIIDWSYFTGNVGHHAPGLLTYQTTTKFKNFKVWSVPMPTVPA